MCHISQFILVTYLYSDTQGVCNDRSDDQSIDSLADQICGAVQMRLPKVANDLFPTTFEEIYTNSDWSTFNLTSIEGILCNGMS